MKARVPLQTANLHDIASFTITNGTTPKSATKKSAPDADKTQQVTFTNGNAVDVTTGKSYEKTLGLNCTSTFHFDSCQWQDSAAYSAPTILNLHDPLKDLSSINAATSAFHMKRKRKTK